jgi:hypothetical protein
MAKVKHQERCVKRRKQNRNKGLNVKQQAKGKGNHEKGANQRGGITKNLKRRADGQEQKSNQQELMTREEGVGMGKF